MKYNFDSFLWHSALVSFSSVPSGGVLSHFLCVKKTAAAPSVTPSRQPASMQGEKRKTLRHPRTPVTWNVLGHLMLQPQSHTHTNIKSFAGEMPRGKTLRVSRAIFFSEVCRVPPCPVVMVMLLACMSDGDMQRHKDACSNYSLRQVTAETQMSPVMCCFCGIFPCAYFHGFWI